jgi:hypothetical protein
MGGWLRSIRYIEIEPLEGAGCILSTGELFIGMFGGYFVKKHGKALRRGFAAHDEALKAEAEAKWQTGGAGAAG